MKSENPLMICGRCGSSAPGSFLCEACFESVSWPRADREKTPKEQTEIKCPPILRH